MPAEETRCSCLIAEEDCKHVPPTTYWSLSNYKLITREQIIYLSHVRFNTKTNLHMN